MGCDTQPLECGFPVGGNLVPMRGVGNGHVHSGGNDDLSLIQMLHHALVVQHIVIDNLLDQRSVPEESIVPGLLREYRAAKADTARSSLLAKISFNLILSDSDSAKLTGEQALLIASRIHDPKSLGDAHHSLGWLAATRGDLDSAEAHMQKALALFQQIGNPVLTAPALGNLGSLAEKRGDDAGALKYFIEALKLAEHAHDSSSMAGLHYSIGVSYRKMGDDDQALSFLNEALDMERALKRPNKEANCLTSLANVYNQQGDTAKAMGYYGQATEVLTAIGNHRQLGLVEENIGTLFEKSAPERAMTHYMLALAEYNKIGSKEDQAYVMGNIGKLQVDYSRICGKRARCWKQAVCWLWKWERSAW